MVAGGRSASKGEGGGHGGDGEGHHSQGPQSSQRWGGNLHPAYTSFSLQESLPIPQENSFGQTCLGAGVSNSWQRAGTVPCQAPRSESPIQDPTTCCDSKAFACPAKR